MKIQPAGRSLVQRRYDRIDNISTTGRAYTDSTHRLATSQAEAHEILVKQRVNRPVSPHLSIYRPQITWYSSGLNRLTAVIITGSFYLWGFAYLAAPYTGWHLETQSMVAAVAAWPAAVKIGVKSFFALPFFFHAYQGIRHLVWDFGIGMKNAAVIKSGWTAVALTFISTFYYVFAV